MTQQSHWGNQNWKRHMYSNVHRSTVYNSPRSKHLLISWLQSSSAVILEPPKIKSATVSPSICHEVMGPDAMILIFWMLSFKPTFSLSSFTFDPWGGKILWRRKWQSTPVLLPGKFCGWRCLVGFSPWGRKELDTTVRLHFLSFTFIKRLFSSSSFLP